MATVAAVDVNLFAGAGGLSLGVQRAGFSPAFHYEIDSSANKTLKRNRLGRQLPPDWSLHRGDVTKVEWSVFPHRVRLLAGGVPCQPFSLAGKHLAERDGRNHFPDFLRAVRVLQPQAILIENVQGLLRSDFKPYFDYVIRTLRVPSLSPKNWELWQDHDLRLRQNEKRRAYLDEYVVQYALVNAADFGVPQVRKRVIVVALKEGAPSFSFPNPTHSKTALIRSQLLGDYWEQRELGRPAGLRALLGPIPEDDGLLPWITVRDVLDSLPAPSPEEEPSPIKGALPNHWILRGARSYFGHTGSRRDWPSKTIKAGVHGVPGGENTVRLGEKRVRYFTLREAACIQTFPRRHTFEGSRLQITRQIGNAVPPVLAAAVARPILAALESSVELVNSRSR